MIDLHADDGEIAFSGGHFAQGAAFGGVRGGDGGVHVVAGALQGGGGGLEFGAGGVAGEDGEFEIALGFELLGVQLFRAGEIQQRRLGGDLGPGDPLLGASDGLRFGEFLLRDLRGEGLDAALCEVAAAFGGQALRFEVVEEVGVVVLDLDDQLPLLHTLAFGDVQVLHTASDLRFDVDAAVQGIEGDDAAGAGDELPPWQKAKREHEHYEADDQQAAEDAGELGAASEAERGQWRGGGRECHGVGNAE